MQCHYIYFYPKLHWLFWHNLNPLWPFEPSESFVILNWLKQAQIITLPPHARTVDTHRHMYRMCLCVNGRLLPICLVKTGWWWVSCPGCISTLLDRWLNFQIMSLFNSCLQRAPFQTVFSTLGLFHCSDLLFVRSSQSEEELKWQ